MVDEEDRCWARVVFSKSVGQEMADGIPKGHVVGNLAASCWIIVPIVQEPDPSQQSSRVILVSHVNPRGNVEKQKWAASML